MAGFCATPSPESPHSCPRRAHCPRRLLRQSPGASRSVGFRATRSKRRAADPGANKVQPAGHGRRLRRRLASPVTGCGPAPSRAAVPRRRCRAGSADLHAGRGGPRPRGSTMRLADRDRVRARPLRKRRGSGRASRKSASGHRLANAARKVSSTPPGLRGPMDGLTGRRQQPEQRVPICAQRELRSPRNVRAGSDRCEDRRDPGRIRTWTST
jgi:hypothetical protein